MERRGERDEGGEKTKHTSFLYSSRERRRESLHGSPLGEEGEEPPGRGGGGGPRGERGGPGGPRGETGPDEAGGLGGPAIQEEGRIEKEEN